MLVSKNKLVVRSRSNVLKLTNVSVIVSQLKRLRKLPRKK